MGCMFNRIMVFSASIGHGHVRAAQALEEDPADCQAAEEGKQDGRRLLALRSLSHRRRIAHGP